jgi:TonB family protein
MKTLRRPVVLAMILASTLSASSGDVKVIANNNVSTDSISVAELRSIFLLQRKSLKDGSTVEPVLQKGGAAHAAFFGQFLHRDAEEIRVYYQGMVFTGKGSMPKELDSDAAVVAYVARTRGAVGYVSGVADTNGVKVLTVVSRESNVERTVLVRVEAEYPKELQQRGIEGMVRLAVKVSPKGSVDSVQVIGGNPVLADAAVKAVKQWVYSPSAGTSTIEVSIPFRVRP